MPLNQVFVLPKSIDAQAGALVEPLSVAWHAVALAGIDETATVLVVGAGPVGLGIVLALRARGVGRILVSEPSSTRRDLAISLGAHAFDPAAQDAAALVESQTGGRRVDVSFESAGAGAATLETAVTAVRPGGRVIIVALYHQPVTFNPHSIIFTERHVVGSFGYQDEDYREVIDALATGAMDASSLITRIINLDDVVEEGLLSLAAGEGRANQVKILVAP